MVSQYDTLPFVDFQNKQKKVGRMGYFWDIQYRWNVWDAGVIE